MLTAYTLFAVLALSSVTIADRPTEIDVSSPTFTKTKRGIIKQEHDIAQDHSFHETTGSAASVPSSLLPKNDNLKAFSYYAKTPTQNAQQTGKIYEVHDRAQSQKGPAEHLSPYSSLPTSNRQLQSHGNLKHPGAQYENIFLVPNKYKVTNSAAKSPRLVDTLKKPKEITAYSVNPDTFSKSEGFGKLSNLKNFDFPSYHSSLTQTSPRAAQSGSLPSNVQVPLYKSAYPVPKPTDYSSLYAPVVQTASNTVPAFRAYEKIKQTGPYGGAKDVNANDKVFSLPFLPPPTARAVPDYAHTFQSQPIVLGTGLDYPTISTVGYNYGGGIANQNGAPFSSPMSSFQGQVVPIQKASSTPQFPQYKGASIQFYPTAATLSSSGAYGPLLTQPQLQFRKPKAEEIRTDVEVINKKKPPPPPPTKDPDTDDEEDEGYKSVEKEYGQDSQTDDDYDYHPRQNFKGSAAESDFTPSKSFPFRQYDELFGKYSKDNSDENIEDKPHSKHRDYSSSASDDDGDYTLSAKYHSENSSYKPVYDKYEENDEEEEEETKQVESRHKFEGSPDYAYKTKSSKYFNKDLGQEFPDSFRKQTSKYSKYRS